MFAPTGEVCNAGSRVGAKKKGEEAVRREERMRERETSGDKSGSGGRWKRERGEGEKSESGEKGNGMRGCRFFF